MFQVFILVILAACTEGLRTRVHMQLQAEPDTACTTWLASQEGQAFVNCSAGNPGVPVPNPDNNCELTQDEMDGYCADPCFSTLTDGYDFMLQTGTCLPVYEDQFKPCVNDTDCIDNGLGPRMCYQGFCYDSCNASADCNYCIGETCDDLGSSKGCRSNITRPIQTASSLVNRTIHNTFRGTIFSIKAACSQNSDNKYCAFLNLANATCDTLTQWGCCATTIFSSMQSCEWKNFTSASNLTHLFNCNYTQTPCDSLPNAKQFCQVVNITSGSSSGSSSSSGSWTGSTGGTGGTGSTGVGGTGNGAGKHSISWTITIALVLAVARVVS